MGLDDLLSIAIVLLLVSLTGYTLVVLKEKRYLKSKSIVIDRKGFQEEHMEGADMKVFKLGKWVLKSGDEVKLILKDKQKIKGIVLGAKKNSDVVIIFTYDDKRIEYSVGSISKVILISRYGSFFR